MMYKLGPVPRYSFFGRFGVGNSSTRRVGSLSFDHDVQLFYTPTDPKKTYHRFSS
jgi:hypothetical protein